MADPLTKRKTGVFEDFPLPERKHFDAHRAARGSLGAGFAPMDEEKRAFAHLKRDNVRKDSHGSATIGGTDKSAWKSSYQAFADGSDDIGKVRRLSRKKSHQGAQQQRSELSLFQSGRTFLTGRDEIENDRGDNRMPGYTGHVPKANGAGTKGDNRNPADKSLLAENYRHNVVGYTGHIKRNFLPYGLVTAIAVSVLAPGLGCAVHSLRVHKLSAPGIFLLSGLSLRLEDVRKAVRSPAPLLLGVGLISLALPWSAQVALRWPFLPRDLLCGAAVFLCMPTALSTGVQISAANGGSAALGLLLTVCTNLLSVLTIPFYVSRFLAGWGGNGLEVDAAALFTSLVRSVLVPMAAGSCARAASASVARWADANKAKLSILSACLLILVPLAELSKSVRGGLVLPAAQLAQVTLLGFLFPAVFALVNRTACSLFLSSRTSEDKQARVTVTVTSSLKTLPSAVMVVQKMQEIVPELTGAALVPCMVFHICQTLLVSALASNDLLS